MPDSNHEKLLLLYWLHVIFLFVYGIFIALGSPSSFPTALKTMSFMPHLYDKPVGEDGFYMLMVAWNLADGRGLVGNFDQQVTGIQPLSTFIFAAIAAVVKMLGGNKDEFVRAVVVFGTLNMILFAHFIGKLSARVTNSYLPSGLIYFFSVLLVCSSYYIFRLFTYGLETGVYLTCLAALLIQYTKINTKNKPSVFLSKDIIILGVLVGVTGLARLDFGIVFAILIIYCLFVKRERLPSLIVSGAIGATLVIPWLIYVYLITGTPIPSSGPAQASLLTLTSFSGRFTAMYSAFIQNAVPTIFVGGKWYTLAVASLALVALIWAFKKLRSFPKLSDLNDWIIPLLSLTLVYVTFFWAGHFYARYTAPLLLIFIPLTSTVLVYITTTTEKFRFATLASFGSVSVFLLFAFVSLHTGSVGNSHSVTAGLIAREMPDTVVGAFQSGVIGFVNPKVINLDGKVNFKVLPYIKEGNIDAYLEANKDIKVIVDWPGYISSFISPQYLSLSWIACVDGALWGSIGYCRKN